MGKFLKEHALRNVQINHGTNKFNAKIYKRKVRIYRGKDVWQTKLTQRFLFSDWLVKLHSALKTV